MRKLSEIKSDLLAALHAVYREHGSNGSLQLTNARKQIQTGPPGSLEQALESLRDEGLIKYLATLGPDGIHDIQLTPYGIEERESEPSAEAPATGTGSIVSDQINAHGGRPDR